MFFLVDLEDERIYKVKTKEEVKKIILGWIEEETEIEQIEAGIESNNILLIEGEELPHIKFKKQTVTIEL